MVKEAIKKADILIEALPYIKKFHKKIFVIKYGGSILSEDRVRKSVLEDIVFLRYAGIRPLIVHGGGPNINKRLEHERRQSKFIDGMRVTDQFTLDIVKQELDNLNDMIVEAINAQGVKAKGFKGDSSLIKAHKKKSKFDLGFVGEVTGFDSASLKDCFKENVPVVSPLGISQDNQLYNINADEVACFMASEFKAEKFVLLTDVLGVMRDPQDENSLISTITLHAIEGLIKERVIGEGMVPKVRAAAKAIRSGVNKAHIVDAKIPHALLLEIFTNEGISTEIVQ